MQAVNKLTTLIIDNCLKHPNKFYNRNSNRCLLNILSQSYNWNKEYSTMQENPKQDCTPELAHDCEQVFVQQNLDKGMMTISFNYKFNGKNKQFNLQRKTSEPLSCSIDRIKLNISKLGKKSKNKAEQPSATNEDEFSVEVSINGSTIDPSKTSNGDAWIEGAVLELEGKPYQIKANSPQVESLDLPACMMRDFITMPMVKVINCDISDCQFTWYRRISGQERANMDDDHLQLVEFDARFYWYKISNEIYYCPTDEDVAHYLKVVCYPTNGNKTGPELSCVSKSPIEIGPAYCPFEKRHLLTKARPSGPEEFRIVTYNILADLYADSDYSREVLFGHCPTHALELEYRRQLLLKEISGYNADLICLQEVDKKEFLRTYQPFLKHIGNFSGIFNTKGGQVAEGQATFYRNDKYECVDSHRTILSSLIEPLKVVEQADDKNQGLEDNNKIEEQSHDDIIHPILNDRESTEAKKCLSKFDGIRSAILKNQELRKRFVDRHTIVQTTLLRYKELSNSYIVIANTHLYFAPDADHVRLLQGSVCVKYLEYLKEFYSNMLSAKGIMNPNLSFILCGDMNSTPDCGLYRLLTRGQVPDNLPDWKSNEDEAVVGLNLETNLRFSSAYEDIKYTNYTLGFNGCLDYIYYDKDALICESIVPLPSHEDVTAIGGIPSDVFPSDHLALIANLKHSRQTNASR